MNGCTPHLVGVGDNRIGKEATLGEGPLIPAGKVRSFEKSVEAIASAYDYRRQRRRFPFRSACPPTIFRHRKGDISKWLLHAKNPIIDIMLNDINGLAFILYWEGGWNQELP